MAVSLDDIRAARARRLNPQPAPAAGQPAGVTIEDVQAARLRRQAADQDQEGGGFLDFLRDTAGAATEFVAKPLLDARDVLDQGVTPTESFPYFQLPESIGERRDRTSETGRTLAAIAAPAAGGAAGAAALAGRGVLGRAAGAGLGSGVGDVLGQAGEDVAQGRIPDIDEEQALISAALGGVGQPIGEALTAVPQAVGRFTNRTFGGPGIGTGLGGGQGPGARARRPKFARQIEALDEAGVPLTPGQRSGNTSEIMAETTAAPTVLGGHLMDTLDDQSAVVRSRMMQMAGFEPDDVPDGVIDIDTIRRAKDRFAQRYGEAFDGVDVDLGTEKFSDAIADIRIQNTELLPFEQRDQLTRVIDDFERSMTEDALTGQRYQQVRSRLGHLERGTQLNNPVISQMYGDMKGALDDAFADAAGGATGAAKRAIDRDYRNFKVLEKASHSAGADVAGGEPTIRNIANRARNQTKGATDDFRRLADAAQDIVTDRTPNSGTPSRLMGMVEGARAQATRAGIRGGRALGLGRGTPRPPGGPSLIGSQAGAVPSIYDALTMPEEISPEDDRERVDFLNSLLEAEALLQQEAQQQ